MNEHLKPDIDFEKAQGWANYWLACRVEHASRNMARAYLALEARLANERAKLAIAIEAMNDVEGHDAVSDRAIILNALAAVNELEKQHGKT